MGGSSPAGDDFISSLTAVSGDDRARDPSIYIAVIEGIVGFISSIGSPCWTASDFEVSFVVIPFDCGEGSEGPWAFCLNLLTASAATARSSPSFST
jgi:hypothetical protein